MQNYLLSVITVVKNDQDNIEKTIKSILSQKKINYEYIIIDGKSKDSTLKKIKKYKSKIKKIISEHDTGIYDAMNKGLKNSKGDVVVFCNSGDTFNKNSLRKVMKMFNEKNYDFIFATVMRNYTKSQILKSGYNFKRFLYNFDFATSHTTGFFLKKKIYEKIGYYDTKFKISADYDLYFRLYKGKFFGGSTKKKDIIGNVVSGGFSSKISFFEHLIEEAKIRIHNKQNILLVIIIFINSLIKKLFKK